MSPYNPGMKVAMVIYGTRGDVQPMVALALAMRKAGHEIILCAPPENEGLATAYGCPFAAIGSSIKELFQKGAATSESPRTRPTPKFLRQEIATQIERLPGIIKGSAAVLGVGYALGVPTVADHLGIPYRFVAFYPAILAPAETPRWAGDCSGGSAEE